MTASHSHVLASGRASEEDVTWASLCKRQQRVISGMGEIEKRLRQMELKLVTKFGWTNAQAQPKPTVQGPEWAALRQRQQDLLESICAVKDRMKALGISLWNYKRGACGKHRETASNEKSTVTFQQQSIGGFHKDRTRCILLLLPHPHRPILPTLLRNFLLWC